MSRLAPQQVYVCRGQEHSSLLAPAPGDQWLHVLFDERTTELSSQVLIPTQRMPAAALDHLEAIACPSSLYRDLQELAYDLHLRSQATAA